MTDQRPNFVIFMTDQQRGDCLSAEGHPVLLTPNMDDIGNRGVRFSRAYSTCPVCVPARRSFISGQFPQTHGALNNIHSDWDPPATLAATLRDAGYQTAWIGRGMHLHPPCKRYGFEEMVVKDHRIQPDDYDRWFQRFGPVDGEGYYGSGVRHNDWTARPYHMPDQFHATNWTVSRAIEWLDRRDTTRPFFLVVSFIAPHPPLVPPAFYMERYLRTGVPDPVIGEWAAPPELEHPGPSPSQIRLEGEALLSARAAYYGLINHVDDQMHRIVAETAEGVDTRTNGNVVVGHFADHGEMLGDHHFWRKSVPYEGAARIPMLLRVPKRYGVAPGAVVDAPVCIEDLMPTFLDLADVPVPASVEGPQSAPPYARRHAELAALRYHRIEPGRRRSHALEIADRRAREIRAVPERRKRAVLRPDRGSRGAARPGPRPRARGTPPDVAAALWGVIAPRALRNSTHRHPIASRVS